MATGVGRASAIGAQPYYGVDGSNRYVESSNLTPSFPSTECLHHGTFKVVVGSWRRLNEGKTSTNDFAVNVSTYAPRTTPVTRVTLVDVDIPPTQHLIEEPWSRVYFDNGIYPTPDCRAFTLDAIVGAALRISSTVLLPLHLDAVTSYQKLTTSVPTTRIFLAHRAPCPIAAIAEAWGGLAVRGCGALQLIGVPGIPGGVFVLPASSVHDDSAMSFDIQSQELFDGLPLSSSGSPTGMYLCAAPIPGPSYLGTIVARCASEALTSLTSRMLPATLSPSCVPPEFVWRLDILYAPGTDRYTLTVQPPELVQGLTLSGAVAAYMGFGSPVVLDVVPRRAVNAVAQSPRYQSPLSYACIAVGSPHTGTAFATRIQSAFDAFSWGSGFQFKVTLPGTAVQTVTVPGGNMSLDTLASVVQDAMDAVFVTPYGVQFVVTYRTCGPVAEPSFSGLVFAAVAVSTTVAVAFAIDFSTDPTFTPARIGYDAKTYPAAAVHYPTRRAAHCPELAAGAGIGCACTTPRANTSVLYRIDTQELVLQTVPFPAFPATASSTAVPGTYTITATTAQALQIGAAVILAQYDAGTHVYIQRHAHVVTVVDVFTYGVVLDDPTGAPAWINVPVTAVPQDQPPLNLYFQQTLHNVVTSEVLGFQPRTYSACGELVSPGTVDVRQDPYILLCLGFEGPSATPLTGDVYYPFLSPSNNQLVFAKVARAAGCIYRSDFDKVFDHTFNGAGTTLGYIRVQVLNPNGTPYQTHGHTVSITLKFDTRESGVALGDGTVSIGIGDNPGDASHVLGNGRGMVRPPIAMSAISTMNSAGPPPPSRNDDAFGSRRSQRSRNA